MIIYGTEGGDRLATLNMGNSNIIGISYNEMNKMKSNLKRSQQMLETSQRNVSTARVQLQVDRGRLRVTEDSLSSIYSEASKRKTKIDKMCSNIDYTIRRFKEVDSKCAQRIRAIGNSYNTKTSLFDKIKNAMISLGNYIFGRVTSLLKEGQDAFDNLGNKNSTEKDSYLEMIDSPYSMSDNPTLGQLIELNPNAPMYENAASEGQKYFLVWYYGSAAYERLDAATLSHNSYLVYKLTNLYKEGVDLSKLTITDIDRMCFDNASFWTKADQVAVGAYGAYTGYKYIKDNNVSKPKNNIDIEEVSGDNSKKGNGADVGEKTVTYRRVQGGGSKELILVNDDGTLSLNSKWKSDHNLNVSTGKDHSNYFKNKRPDSYIVEFEVPQYVDDLIKENAISQNGYKTNPSNQGGTAPKIVDKGVFDKYNFEGVAYELPDPINRWLVEYAQNGNVIK